MHSALTGVQVLVTRACPLIGLFLLGFTYCGGKERESDIKVSYSDACSLVTFFWGFIL
jgi:hypothetical protein